MQRLIFNWFLFSSLILTLGCDGSSKDADTADALEADKATVSFSQAENINSWYDHDDQANSAGGGIEYVHPTIASHIMAPGDNSTPKNTRHLRSEYSECRSEIENPNTTFYNVGSLCLDGLFSLIEGRGCENIAYEKTEGGWIYHYCNDTPTCDRLHEGMFLTVPTNIEVSDSVLEDYSLWCMDSGYGVFYTKEKTTRDEAAVHHVADGVEAAISD